MDRHPVRQNHVSEPRAGHAGERAGVTENTVPVPFNPPGSLIPPLLAWLAIQLAALAVICFRIPLWAKYPQPPDALAAATMLVVQNIAAAILFPLFFRTVKSSLVIAATAWPMLLAAGAIASIPTTPLLLSGLYQTAVFANFCLWGLVIKSRAAAMSVGAIATSLVIGPTVLEYLRLEFNPNATFLEPIRRPTPLSAGLEALSGSIQPASWILLAVIAIPPTVLLIARHRTSK